MGAGVLSGRGASVRAISGLRGEGYHGGGKGGEVGGGGPVCPPLSDPLSRLRVPVGVLVCPLHALAVVRVSTDSRTSFGKH